MNKTKFGLLICDIHHNCNNLGDYIQGIAAAQFLSRVDCWVDRENLINYNNLAEKIFIIMNGFFYFGNKSSISFGNSIVPLLTPMHFYEKGQRFLEKNPNYLNYFRTNQPIGCRDTSSVDFLQKHNIDAYFSGCLTLTLDRENFVPANKKRNGIVCVYDYMKKNKRITLGGRRVKYFFHKYFSNSLQFMKFPISVIIKIIGAKIKLNPIDAKHIWANHLLSVYANAEFVITNRLHVAMPCLAFGTPVLFFNHNLNNPRFGGLIEHVTKINMDGFLKGLKKGEWEINDKKTAWHEIKNPNTHLEIREKLKAQARAFVEDAKASKLV